MIICFLFCFIGLNQKRSKRGYNQLAQTQKITDESKSDPKEDNDSISSYSVSSDEERKFDMLKHRS